MNKLVVVLHDIDVDEYDEKFCSESCDYLVGSECNLFDEHISYEQYAHDQYAAARCKECLKVKVVSE